MKPPGKLIQRNSRFLLLVPVAVALLAVFANGSLRAERASSFPAPESLQTGDLIWPKKPGAVVPYNSEPGAADKSDEQRWKKEKEAYLAELRGKRNPSSDEKARYSAL